MINNLMLNKFVQVLCDVDCDWDVQHPKYRVFVNDELFTERTWIWRGQYLEEMLQIYGPPGKYTVRFEVVDPGLGTMLVKNLRVKAGDAVIVKNDTLEIIG